MKKINKRFITAILTFGLLVIPTGVDAASYTIQQGDTFYSLAKKYGTTVKNLQIANQQSGHLLNVGQTMKVPSNISTSEKELMARLVHAEAKGEPYAGKVAVATVVLNRVDHKEFPNSIKEVIYERSAGGHYAFTPVQNGTLHGGYTEEDMEAVNEALAFRGQGNNSIYFYNPETSKSEWILSREVTVTIGNHRFAK